MSFEQPPQTTPEKQPEVPEKKTYEQLKPEVQEYINEKHPLDLGQEQEVNLELLDERHHFNVKATEGEKDFLFRINKPEAQTRGLFTPKQEYQTLKFVSGKEVAPEAHYFDQDAFDGSALIIEEHVEGETYNIKKYDDEKIRAVARLAARVNEIDPEEFQKQVETPESWDYSTYERSLTEWDERLAVVEARTEFAEILHLVKGLIDRYKKLLPQMQKTLDDAGKSFIYNDAHPGGNIKFLKDGEARFLDWEKASVGDPSMTSAVFLKGFTARKNFDQILETYVKEFQKTSKVESLDLLIKQRILERKVADIVWVLWNWCMKKEASPAHPESPESAIENVNRRIPDAENYFEDIEKNYQ